jgi:hypothetical protein
MRCAYSQFEADESRADHNQVLGNGVPGERLGRGAHAFAVDLDAFQGSAEAAGREQHPLRFELGRAVRALDGDACAARQAPGAGVARDLVLLEQTVDALRQGGHDAILALHHRAQVERQAAGGDAMGGELVAGARIQLARLEQGLARDAAHAQARSAQARLLLDAGHVQAELRRAQRRHVAARAGAEHDQIVSLGHRTRSRAGCARAPRRSP